MTTTPASVTRNAARILGADWTAESGPWDSYGTLTAPTSDTYTLCVDGDHRNLLLECVFHCTDKVASFPPVATPEEAERLAGKVAAAIRTHEAGIKAGED